MINLNQIKRDIKNNSPTGSGTVLELVERVETLTEQLHKIQTTIYIDYGKMDMEPFLAQMLQKLIDRKYGEITVEEHPQFGTILVNDKSEAINATSDLITLMDAVRILKKVKNK